MARPNVLENIDRIKENIDRLEEYDQRTIDMIDSLGMLLTTASYQIAEIQDQLGSMYAPTPASGLTIGKEFFLRESGVLTPFICVDKDYGTTGNFICARKDLLPIPMIYNENSMMVYTGSELDDYLRGEYEDTVEVVYAPAPIVTAYSNGQLGTANLNVFAPSLAEMTGSTYYISNNQIAEGGRFRYFTSNALRVASYDGIPRNYHTRSLQYADINFFITDSGSPSSGTIDTVRYVRPFLSISADATIYEKLVPSTMNILATATISE